MPARVWIDEERITHVDGRRFFLIGARHMPVGGTPEILRQAGFNAFRAMAFGGENAAGEHVPEDLEGIYFWSYIYDRADFSRSADYERELRAWIEQARRHPALLCYENYNEPTLLYKSDQFKTQPERLAVGTQIIRELDPDHPIWLCHSCNNTVETLARFNPCLDIAGCNPYPVHVAGMRQHIGVRADGRMLDCPDQSIHAVGKYTGKMMAVAGGTRPVWMLIQGLANENWFDPVTHNPEFAGQSVDESKILYPSYEQMRFMAFDAVIAGATGLAMSMWKTPVGSRTWDDMVCLVQELKSLSPALSAPPLHAPFPCRYEDLGFTIWDGVRTLARRNGDEVYLFAANTAFDPARVTISVPDDVAEGTGLVVGEERELPIQRRSFTDDFGPYEVHVYRLPTP